MDAVAPVSFKAFGSAHLVGLVCVAVAAIGIGLLVRSGLSPFRCRILRAALASALVVSAVVEQAWALQHGVRTWRAWPFHLCDLNRVLSVVGILTLSPRVVEILYFFALSGTLVAAITPDLPPDLPTARLLNYFALHGLVIFSAVVLTFGFDLVPSAGGWRRAAALLNAYALPMLAVDFLFDANFLYLRTKPAPGTPFDWIGPWPLYLLVLDVAFVVSFYLLDLPLRRLRGGAPTPNRPA